MTFHTDRHLLVSLHDRRCVVRPGMPLVGHSEAGGRTFWMLGYEAKTDLVMVRATEPSQRRARFFETFPPRVFGLQIVKEQQ